MFKHLALVKLLGFAVAAIMILIAAGYGSVLLASKQELSALVPVVGFTIGFLASYLLANIPALGEVPLWLLRGLPGMNAALRNQKERLEHAALVKDMKQTLKFYKIQCPESVDWKSLEETLGTYRASQEPVIYCVDVVSKVCAIEPKTLELLYYERKRLVPHDLWPPTTDNPFPGLGKILIRSGHLPNDDFDVTAEDVERLVHALSDFRLGLVVAELEKLREVWRNAESYLMFLKKNHLVADKTAVNTAAMLNTIASQEDGLPTSPNNFRLISDATFPVLRTVCKEGFKGHMATDGDELNALFLISVVIFCTRSERIWPFLPEVSKLLARNPFGTPMVWAYLEVKQDFRKGNWSGARPFLRLNEYYKKWREKYLERKAMPGSSLKREEEALYDALMGGAWIISREKLMNTVLKIPTVPSEQGEETTTIPARATPAPLPSKAPLEMLRSTPGVKRPLQQLFGLLELDTVERYLETKTITPYLLTLGQSTGPASSLLDCMASEENKTFLERLGVEFLGPDEKPNYNFRHYTPYARIGIVPANKSFSDFCKLFKKDFNKLLEYHNDYLWSEDTKKIHRYEILIHAFSPAVDNPFDFGVPAGRRPALQRIKMLFAEVLDNVEMYALIKYEGRFERDVHVKLMEVIMKSTIADMTGTWKDISEVDRHALDTADHSIKVDFLGTLGIASEQERALIPYLEPGTDKRKQAVEALQQAIMKCVPEFKEKEQFCADLACAYLDEISATSRGLLELERELGRAHLASRT